MCLNLQAVLLVTHKYRKINSMSKRNLIPQAKRWVVKIGSALLTNDGKGLDVQAIAGWVAQMAKLREQGIEIVLVSSGAVAAGIRRFGLQYLPPVNHQLPADGEVHQFHHALILAFEF